MKLLTMKLFPSPKNRSAQKGAWCHPEHREESTYFGDRRIKKILRFVLLIFFTSVFAFYSQREAIAEDGVQQTKEVKIYQENSKAIIAKFSDGKIWHDENKHDELCKLMETVTILRLKPLAGLLAKHIGYNRGTDKDNPLRNLKRLYPVYTALKGIGLPSVQPLLDELKKIDPDLKMRDRLKATTHREEFWEILMISNDRKSMLVLSCLAEIYDQGGHGKELVCVRKPKQQRSQGVAAIKD